MKNVIHILLVSIVIVFFLSVNHVIAQTWQSTNGPTRGTTNVVDLTGGASSTLYVVEPSAFYKTTNAGATWMPITNLGATPKVVTSKPTTPSDVVASWNSYVKYSTNTGSNWTASNISNETCMEPISAATAPANQALMFIGINKYSGRQSLLRSLDGGQNWYYVPSFFSTIQTDVTAISGHPTNGLIAFAGGATPPSRTCGQQVIEEETAIYTNGVFFSTNAGVDWYNSGDLQQNVTALTNYVSGGTIYVFAASGSILYKSTNATNTGASWTVVTSPGGSINHLNATGSTLYAATSTGIYASTNHGTSWTCLKANMVDSDNMKRIVTDPANSNNLFAGSSTNFYKSTDGGGTWTDIAPNSLNVSCVAVTTKGSVYLAAPSGYGVLYKNPNGSAWSSALLETCGSDFRGNMIGFVSSASSNVFATGYTSNDNKASLRLSTDAGSTWTVITDLSGTYSGGKYNGVTVDPANSQRIYVYGKKDATSNIWVTVNGGSSWESVSLSTSPLISDLVIDSTGHGASSSNILYAAVYTGTSSEKGIWKSTTAGASWNRLTHALVQGWPVKALGLNHKAPGVLYAAGGSSGAWALRKSTDGGTNWSTISTMTVEVSRIVFHPYYPTSNQHFFVLAPGVNKIYKTADGGTTSPWTNATGNIPTPIYDLRSDFTSTTKLYAATASGVYWLDVAPPAAPTNVQISTPPGGGHPTVTWNANSESDLHSTLPYQVWRYFLDYEYVINKWVVTWIGPASKIADVNTTSYTDNSQTASGASCQPGEIWHKVAYYIVARDNIDNVSANSFSVTRTLNCEDEWNPEKTVIRHDGEEESVQQPLEYALSTNFPNPFNPQTQINYALPEDSYVTLKIYDVLGNEVALVVNEFQKAGYKEATFDASNLPSGVYFYRLQAGKFIEMKKMLLMK